MNYHPDEPKIIQAAANFPSFIWLNTDFRYPTFFHHILGLLSLPLYKLELSNPDLHIELVNLIGRALSVLAGIGAVMLTFKLARKLYSVPTALLASFLLSFAMYHVVSSAWATTDVLASFFMVLFMILFIQAIEKDALKDYLFAGIALGLLVGTKYTGLIALVFLLTLLIHERILKHSDLTWLRRALLFISDKKLWLLGIIAILTFFVCTPGILLHPEAFFNSYQFEADRLDRSQIPLTEGIVWLNLFEKLCITVGLPMAVAMMMGLFLPVRKSLMEWAITLTFIGYCLLFGNSMRERYYILLLPLLVIPASNVLVSLVKLRPRTRILGILVIIGICLYSFLYSTAAIISRYPDPRTIAAQYIEEHIPMGSSIGIAYSSPEFNWQSHKWRYPKIEFDRYKFKDFLTKNPEYIIISSYDADPIREAIQKGWLNPDFTLPEKYHPMWYQSSPPSPEIFEFYAKLMEGTEERYFLRKSFTPRILVPIEFPPPTIEIYQRLPQR